MFKRSVHVCVHSALAPHDASRVGDTSGLKPGIKDPDPMLETVAGLVDELFEMLGSGEAGFFLRLILAMIACRCI